MAWVAAQATPNGNFPEQVERNLLVPEGGRPEISAGAGGDATALVERDAADAGARSRRCRAAGCRRLIRHRPAGRGHPYLLEADQRVPIDPVVGQPLELRASTDQHVRCVIVEFADGAELEAKLRGPAVVDEVTDYSQLAPRPAAASHLAAGGGGARGRLSWATRLDPVGTARLRYRFRAEAPSRISRTRWFEVAPAAWRDDGGELIIDGDPVEVVDAASAAWLIGDEGPARARFALRLAPDNHVVGFGERFDAVDQRSRRLDAVVFEQYKGQGSRTYLPMPYALVLGGDMAWGLYVATSRRVWFDVGATDPDRLWVEVELARDRPASLTVHLFSGAPYDVLRQFLDLTGPPKLPPDWIFEPWMSGNEWNTQERVLAEVAATEAHGIPAGVVVIEAWSDEMTFVAFRDAQYEPHRDGSPHRLADFTFPANGAWPDPKAMVDELHERGLRVLLWQVPLLKTTRAPEVQARIDREVMVERGYAVKTASGRPYRNRGWWFRGALLPDWTNDDARRWWMDKRRYLIDEVGIDGFKTDGGEHAWGRDVRYADGSDGATSNNLFPLRYAAAFHNFYDEVGREAITFSRAGYTGASSYPCHWAGDEDSTWEAFRASVVAGITAGACGVFFWGWDLAGFSGEIPSAELYLRAAAMASFCPIMQYHSEYNHHQRPSDDRTPWNIAKRTGDARVIPIFRKFALLRRRLIPYLAEQARVSVERRKPLMRGLFFDWPDDADIWRFPHQYLLGDELLVAPVLEPASDASEIYLPPGKWREAWRGELHDGPKALSVDSPLDEIPLFIRAEANSVARRFETAGSSR